MSPPNPLTPLLLHVAVHRTMEFPLIKSKFDPWKQLLSTPRVNFLETLSANSLKNKLFLCQSMTQRSRRFSQRVLIIITKDSLQLKQEWHSKNIAKLSPNARIPMSNIMQTECARTAIMLRDAQSLPLSASITTGNSMRRASAKTVTSASTTRRSEPSRGSLGYRPPP
jgi:hypothetical protein